MDTRKIVQAPCLSSGQTLTLICVSKFRAIHVVNEFLQILC
jgi:hypothetical protein